MTFFDCTLIITKDDPSGWHARVPELPGCHSFGDTPEEARENCKEAILLYLETKEKTNKYISPAPSFVEKISITIPQSFHISSPQYT